MKWRLPSLRKVLLVTRFEFWGAVRAKSFVIGIFAVPVLIALTFLVEGYAEHSLVQQELTFGLVDHSGGTARAVLEEEVRLHNLELLAGRRSDPGTLVQAQLRAKTGQETPLESRLVLLPIDSSLSFSQSSHAYEEQVRRGELFAYAELPENFFAPSSRSPELRYLSDHPAFGSLRDWIREKLQAELLERQLAIHGLPRSVDDELHRPILVRELRPSGAGGGTPEPVDEFRTIALPAALMFLQFMVVMSGSGRLLNSVLEEKMSKLAEVLLGSVSPFELLFGKLLSSCGISLLLSSVYLIGFATIAGKLSLGVPAGSVFEWFAVFLLLHVLLVGSILIAIGAACNDIKDTQTLMMPAMMFIAFPFVAWLPILKDPGGPFAVALSLFPLTSPPVMMLRLASQPAPPLWQTGLSIVIASAFTVLCVIASGKILRMGLLMQGKAASFREMWRWIRTP